MKCQFTLIEFGRNSYIISERDKEPHVAFSPGDRGASKVKNLLQKRRAKWLTT